MFRPIYGEIELGKGDEILDFHVGQPLEDGQPAEDEQCSVDLPLPPEEHFKKRSKRTELGGERI